MAKKKRNSPGAVAKAWAIFSKHPKAERKIVLAACTKAGINPNTAKTQYQVWIHATKTERAARADRFTWRPGDLKTGREKQPPPAGSTAQS